MVEKSDSTAAAGAEIPKPGLAANPEGPPAWPRPSEAVKAALVAAYADGSWGRYHGPHVERLKAAIAQLCDRQHVWTCSSGTIAAELALRGLKVGAGDEVILAGYDFPGNFRAIEAVGARPVLVDLAAGTWVIDPEQAAQAITPATRAIIVSHLHGSLADMRRLRAIADRHAIALVEDACQVPGAVVGGRPAGSWGDCGLLSFGGSKLLTSGRGGAVVTHREDMLQRIKVFCERGNDAFPLSELQAAVLVPQIAELDAANRTRLVAIKTLLEACQNVPLVEPLKMPQDAANRPVFYKLPWFVSGTTEEDIMQRRQQLLAALQAESVEIDEGFRGFARRTSQRCRIVSDLVNARRAAAGTVILHHPVLLEPHETILRVAHAMRIVAKRFASNG